MQSYQNTLYERMKNYGSESWKRKKLEEEAKQIQFFAETLTATEIDLICELRDGYPGVTYRFLLVAKHIAEAQQLLDQLEKRD